MVRELFTMARSKRACIIFFDEVDAIGGTRSGSDDNGSDNEVQRTMLQIVTELDGFDARGNIKVLMATNRPDTLDPALLRPGRLDRKVEFGLPDLEGRGHILKIHSKRMNCDRDIRFELIARLCPNTTGAELHSVCTEAGMFAIRARRKSVSEKDFLDSVNKVVKGYKKFSSTPKVSARTSLCCFVDLSHSLHVLTGVVTILLKNRIYSTWYTIDQKTLYSMKVTWGDLLEKAISQGTFCGCKIYSNTPTFHTLPALSNFILLYLVLSCLSSKMKLRP